MRIIEVITAKLTSGKFLFTIGALLVYMYLSFTGKLPVDKVHEITLVVLYAYFTRKGDNGTPKP